MFDADGLGTESLDAEIDRAAIHTHGFRFGEVDDIHALSFLPGGAKYFDLPGMLALGAPGKLWLAGEDSDTPVITKVYAAAGAAKKLTVYEGRTRGVKGQQMMTASVVEWIRP